MMRYFIGFFVAIGLLILLIVLLVSGGGDNQNAPKTQKQLEDYASTSAVVRLTIDGPINAASEHQQVQITVGQDNVVYEQLTGYNGDVTNTRSYANTENAYSDFLHALAHAGFDRGNNDKRLANEQGYCPLGQRFIYELIDGGKTIERYWSTSCGGTKTYRGNAALTTDLFQAQVPDYDTLTQDISFSI